MIDPASRAFLSLARKKKTASLALSFPEAAILLISTKENLLCPFYGIRVTQALRTRLASIE